MKCPTINPGKLYIFDLNEVVIKGDMVARIHDIPVLHLELLTSRKLPCRDFAR